VSWPPRELREAARRLAPPCPDCDRAATVFWSTRKGGWVVDVWHDGCCPTRRTARSERACVRDLTDLLGAALHLADYSAAGDLIAVRHRVTGTP
jgi:hypothetical protein